MKKNCTENYLERKPCRIESIVWKTEENGLVVLEIENNGIFNRIAQKLLKKPKVSYIHLDEMGSFIWQSIDGNKTIIELGKDVEEKFGNQANPLYERLAKYIKILESYNFISFEK